MKKTLTALALAVATLAAVAPARAATYSGDLIIGFSTTSGNDVIFDLGQRSALTSGETWDLSGLFSSASMSLSGTPVINWGVIGNKNVGGTTRTAWVTGLIDPPTLLGTPNYNALNTPTISIAGGSTPLLPGGSITGPASDPNSWNTQTILGPLSGNYVNAYQSPNNQGFTSVPFWEVVANGSSPNQLGSFAFANSAIVTFPAVPAPSSHSLLVLPPLFFFLLPRKPPSVACNPLVPLHSTTTPTPSTPQHPHYVIP